MRLKNLSEFGINICQSTTPRSIASIPVLSVLPSMIFVLASSSIVRNLS